ncbi:protein POLLEN DEFECTIVE IN GUIDANCE 1 [Ipomoea triloba]|uniref:protein POLLEN DEFECTIVE IN GUIDANCE 1 n=1 Tax=Ipomoea triloba TaxID=35885 RepID=UPI00125CE288|nr:protein POLLEN DEFECTIVE IN GUIDANCE 1 [Ipomoea triloba]
MALRSSGRKLSFNILTASADDDGDDLDWLSTAGPALFRSKSDPPRPPPVDDALNPPCSHTKTRKKRKKNQKKAFEYSPISENSTVDEPIRGGSPVEPLNFDSMRYNGSFLQSSVVVCEEVAATGSPREVPDSNCTVSSILGPQYSELRQRSTVLSGACEEGVASFPVSKESESNGDGGSAVEKVDPMTRVEMMNGDGGVGRNLEKEVSLDWKRLMAEDQNHEFHVEKSPMKFLAEEMSAGNSLKNTICLGNEKERERVYDTIFHLPWRCELLINVGFFVCLDSFLSLLTIMPTRIITTFWKILKSRQLNRPSTAELCDFGCFVALIIGVTLLQQTDISLIYHMIRGQGTIKLYVVYNVLEIFDKLFQSFGGDVMQTLFTTAEDLATCSPENMQLWLWRFISDEIIAVTTSIIHSFILLAQAITMSTCIVAHNNALFALLVSNNFTEIKSNVFKRYSKDNVHNLVYSDAVERFHISAFLLFVLAQNILEAEGPWLQSFLYNALVVYICEMMIDIIKHSFIAKFNNIKPMAFSEFLEDLCKQTWNQPENAKNNLVFIPLAPACVVIRVLRPVYAAHLPHNPLPWRLFWILLLSALTFIMLLSLKILVGMGLKKHARWYIKRCQRRKKLHSD